MRSFHFKANPDQCIHCGRCVASCSSVILYFDEQRVPKMKAEADGIVGWDGCYRCQHCLAVCPTGAISMGFGARVSAKKMIGIDLPEMEKKS